MKVRSATSASQPTASVGAPRQADTGTSLIVSGIAQKNLSADDAQTFTTQLVKTGAFDLAGAASYAGFSSEEADEFLAAYFDRAPSPEIRRSHAAMQCASLLRVAMWSMVSELHLAAPGADYAGYTAENLERLEKALDHYRTLYGKPNT